MLKTVTFAFDLDGTLADTLPDIAGAVNFVLGREGLAPLPLTSVRAHIGWGSRVTLARSFAERGVRLEPDAIEAAYESFIAFHRVHLVEGTRLYPHVREVLEGLAADGARLAVCTNKPGVLAHGVLEALGVKGLFAAIVGGDTCPTRKPDPEGLRRAVHEAGGEVGRTLMVGDSHTDVETARNAGTPVVVVDFGYSHAPPATLGADGVISDFAALPARAREVLHSPGRARTHDA